MHARTDEHRKQSTMNPVTFSRRITKLEYKAVRWPFSVLDDRVITRYWKQDALLRSGFRRFLGLLDRFVGWLLADDAISQRGHNLLRQTQDIPREAAIDEPPTDELTLAELAGPAVHDQAAEQFAAPAGPATVSTVDVTFTLPGEVGAGHVALCGDFNNWTAGNIALRRGGDGSWQTTVPLKPGHSYHYRYLLDGERWENAWQADRYEPNPFGTTNSVVIVGSPELALMS